MYVLYQTYVGTNFYTKEICFEERCIALLLDYDPVVWMCGQLEKRSGGASLMVFRSPFSTWT